MVTTRSAVAGNLPLSPTPPLLVAVPTIPSSPTSGVPPSNSAWAASQSSRGGIPFDTSRSGWCSKRGINGNIRTVLDDTAVDAGGGNRQAAWRPSRWRQLAGSGRRGWIGFGRAERRAEKGQHASLHMWLPTTSGQAKWPRIAHWVSGFVLVCRKTNENTGCHSAQ